MSYFTWLAVFGAGFLSCAFVHLVTGAFDEAVILALGAMGCFGLYVVSASFGGSV